MCGRILQLHARHLTYMSHELHNQHDSIAALGDVHHNQIALQLNQHMCITLCTTI